MAEGENDDAQEKVFEASEAKKKKARDKGDVVNSTEVTTTAVYLGFAMAILFLGGPAGLALSELFSSLLAFPDEYARQLLQGQSDGTMGVIIQKVFLSASPFILAPAILVVIALLGQRAFVVAPTKIKPKLSKISPIANAKKKFGPGGLGEFAKSFAKLLAICVIVGVFLSPRYLELPAFAKMPAGILPIEMQKQLLYLLLLITVFSGVLAAVDLPSKIFAHQRKLRMTVKEMRDETREQEGDPHFRQERRQRAREIAMNTMLIDVQTADVIIVNPTHYAVALEWDRTDTAVPVCVAKGVDDVAFRIRERADGFSIPIHSDPPTARSLYGTVEIGDAIRPEHYAAVAAAINFADMLRKERRLAG